MQLEKAKILRRGRIRRAAEKDCECPDVPESLRVFSTKLRTVMSSIMRRRSGLMGFSLIWSSCLEVGVLEPPQSSRRSARPSLALVQIVTAADVIARPRRQVPPAERVRSLILKRHWGPNL